MLPIRNLLLGWIALVAAFQGACVNLAWAQPLGQPDRGEPGDESVQAFLLRRATTLQSSARDDFASAESWKKNRDRYHQEYLYMLGLWPLPEKTPLQATVTGTVDRDDYVVENLHYQSRPRLYCTANVYRPKTVKAGERLPAVLYVCGHSSRGRNGGKTAFQSHGIWLAKHGYVCLIVDTLQLGEIAGIHHGTYNRDRWWWHSRGYTSAGVECWNGVRAIDYLSSRPDVDAERIGITGISGGGAATFWIAAADERAKVVVPVSGMSDLAAYVPNRVINGHCDCMFLYNTFQWPWTRIAALVAPRPLLFANSDQDAIFPMDGNERIINVLERVYSLYGTGDLVDSVVSVGGHDYRHDLRREIFGFLNAHLKQDVRPVTDSEVDLVTDKQHPIPPESLRVFKTDADLPRDELNTTIDQHFVPQATVSAPRTGEFESWKQALVAELRRVSFRSLPERVPEAVQRKGGDPAAISVALETEGGLECRLTYGAAKFPAGTRRILLGVSLDGDAAATLEWMKSIAESQDVLCVCEPRGAGTLRWTQKNPPNYVARAHALLGQTVDTGRVWDVISAARYLKRNSRIENAPAAVEIHAVGKDAAGLLAAYAALWAPEIQGVTLASPPVTHMADGAPQFLNVLRVCDVPEVLGLLAPRRLTIAGVAPEKLQAVRGAYAAAGASDYLSIK